MPHSPATALLTLRPLLPLLPLTLFVAGCGAVIVPGTKGGAECSKEAPPPPPLPPPPAVCPAACTGGCEGPHGDLCVVSAAKANRGRGGLLCPPGMPCRIDCDTTSACQMARLACPPDADCEVRCSALSSCQMAVIECPKEASCKLDCSATSTCQMASLKCGHGKCRSSCGGLSASLGSVDCGGSCDCSTWCGDGGMGMAMAFMPAEVKPMLTPGAWASSARGEVTVRSPGGAAWTARATKCASGEPDGFQGVVIAGDTSPEMVLRIEGEGTTGLHAKLQGVGILPAELTPATCRTLSGEVSSDGRKANRVRLLNGSLTLGCTTTGGAVVSGQVSFQSCQRSDVMAINASLAAIDADTKRRVEAMALVAGPTEVPALRPELSGLRVAVKPFIVGALVSAERPEDADRACRAGMEAFLRRVGLVPVAATEPHGVDIAVSCTGHVDQLATGDLAALLLPRLDGPSVRISQEGRELATVPPGPRELRCGGPGTPAQRMLTCARWASSGAEARIVQGMNNSQALLDVVRRLGGKAL